MSLLRGIRVAAEPLVGALFITFWIVAEAGRGPSLPVIAVLGVAIGISHLLPRAALGLAVGAELLAGAALLLPTTAVTPFVHGLTDTDWPLYLAALVVPALVAATGTRRTLRASLIAAVVAPVGLSALLVVADIGATGEVAVPLLAGSLVLWGLGWVVAGLIRFGRTVLRDPLIRARFNDALKLGPSIDDAPQLTPRERDVLLLVSDGRSNAEIATALFLSEATVKSHLRSILAKLSLKSRTEIVAYAWRTGLVQAV